MAGTAPRTPLRTRAGSTRPRRTGRRHPLVATAMVLPLATLLAYAFGGLEAVVTQASSVGAVLGR
ncbi:hypothetical protein ACL02U_26050 [Streptomyces sp. MS06]|uniref:hypothetical protein n=1 Tax=Streptomyces sp. MS06 TaxID=3385974 RepID=UPI0039A105D9